MDREVEVRTGRRIDAALDRIRSKVCVTGMAGKWHLGKAGRILDSPDLLERYVEPLGENEQAKYLDQLPTLIAEAKEQDRRCADSWDAGSGPEAEGRYLVEREQLIRLFHRFQFRPKVYEPLVRQPDKPLLREAIELLSAGQENTPEAARVERIVRMRLRDFVNLEEGIADDFRDLDEARDELCTAYKELALNIVRSEPGSDESTVSSALDALRRAAASYDYKRGYDFAEYAQHWVRKAIEMRRA